MKSLVFSPTLVMAVAIVCFGQAKKKPTNPLGNAPQVAEAGRLLYNKTCTGCHGPDGGEGERGPALDANRRYFRVSEAAIFDVIKNGIPGTVMPSTGLPDTEIWKIVAFIRNVRATASDLVVPGDIQKGMMVFSGAGRCVRCHMIRGQGGVLGPDLSSIGAQLSLKKLHETLTQPRPIPPGFRPVKVTTLQGETTSGIARNSDAFSLQLLDENGRLHLLEAKDLLTVVYAKESLMPHNFDKTLTPDQYRDLVAMLAAQARTKVRAELQGENEIGR